ncbi:hypothetical protein SAMN04490243_2859 [Robiginitalea myxolifaciens]|uniref:Ava_C0101 and related proteins n=1 Tax=Robiginitalea myxolifaciens TaxID=400055 RepID=A0A1I6HL26_9FLAO|nr:DUF5996 family protein [Robiginitalea myxolifaciens]SFR55104.1 hypothetical protein SAMN04490243_2859 [Robiginitalea myxolifaciens]
MTSKQTQNWPQLSFSEIQDTLETVHQWIQIVGKIRLRTMPWQNHSWHVALYVSTKGFTTNPIPYQGRIFQIDFDFKKHKLYVECSNAGKEEMDLYPRTVADFYRELFEKLDVLGIDVKIHGRPNEMEPAIPFSENTTNKAYDKEAAHAIWKSMLKANEVFNKFRSDFVGKVSPVHLFWGAFDLAVTRFSGEDAPLHQGEMPNMPTDVMQEAYSKEVSSAGFWLGSKDFPFPAFYAYAYPSPEAFGKQEVQPAEAFWSDEMGEFFLKYEDVQQASNPDEVLMSFLQSTYEASVKTAQWDRAKLERN